MITTISQAYVVINRWYQEILHELSYTRRDTAVAKALSQKLANFYTIATMLNAIEYNPRLERMTLDALDQLDRNAIQTLCAFPRSDPAEDQLQIRMDRFKDTLTDIVDEIRGRHYYITIHLFDRSILHLINRMSTVITQINHINTRIQNTRDNLDNPDKPLEQRQADRKNFAARMLKFLREELYAPLRAFYLLKSDFDFYALHHPDYDKENINVLERILKNLFDSICKGPRSIALDINRNYQAGEPKKYYTVKEAYDEILEVMPLVSASRQETLRQILSVLNDLTFSRNAFRIPPRNITESQQSKLARYAIEECDGELLLPLSQDHDPNVANDDGGLCNGNSNNFIFQLATGTGFFSLVNKMGPITTLGNESTTFNFYHSNIRDVNLQKNTDYFVSHTSVMSLDDIRYSYGTSRMPPMKRTFGGKTTNTAQMKTRLEDELKNYNDAFLKIGFWEKGEKVGHAISTCRLDKNGPIHFMDTNKFYIRFKSLVGFLKFYDEYAKECIPVNLGGIYLKTYFTDHLRPVGAHAASSSASASSSSSSSASAASNDSSPPESLLSSTAPTHMMLHMQPFQPLELQPLQRYRANSVFDQAEDTRTSANTNQVQFSTLEYTK